MSQEPAAKSEGVVNLWRSTRTMQIWMEVSEGDFTMREIGPNLSLRKRVGTEKVLLHFDAPRPYWDELTMQPSHAVIDVGLFTAPTWIVVKLLGLLDAKRPKLVKEATTLAAQTQARIDAEKDESGERLPMAT